MISRVLSRIDVPQNPLRNHQLNLVWKTVKYNNNNDNWQEYTVEINFTVIFVAILDQVGIGKEW